MKYLPALLALYFVAAPLQAQPDLVPVKSTDPATRAAQSGPIEEKQAKVLEEKVAINPEDLDARTQLLGYYFLPRPASFNFNAYRRRHILWIIKNHPEAEIAGSPFCLINESVDNEGYREGKLLWAEQLRAHSKDAVVLGHAASFLTINDRTLAAELLKHAKQLEPSNPQLPNQLGHLYQIQDKTENAALSLAEFEQAQTLDGSDKSKVERLGFMAKAAFTAGDIEKARYYAEQALQVGDQHPEDWQYRYAVHQANIALGRIALKQKHTKLAGEYLLKAGQTLGEPVLDSFGPCMNLAQELLKAGQKATVLQYFELCRQFWEFHEAELDRWTKEVKAGKTPDFGANLYY